MVKLSASLRLKACGGNITSEFEKLRYNCFYVNSSQEDLKTIKNIKHYHHIKNGQGAFNDRDMAKNMVREIFDSIINDIVNQNASVINMRGF